MTREHLDTLTKMRDQFRASHNDDRADAIEAALKERQEFAKWLSDTADLLLGKKGDE